jgi:hypothetical protein
MMKAMQQQHMLEAEKQREAQQKVNWVVKFNALSFCFVFMPPTGM